MDCSVTSYLELLIVMDLLNGFPISNLSVSYSGEQNVTETF